ncbi:MAG: polyprenyl synthetase family protein [Bacteroidaceae bacterium]|nr:polyprenyl synthetase family protein [Bacteroidaceae bacterium]MEA5100445.1 polyprenyl synthetase family protein [Bacteroidales bacterium]
MRKIEELQEIAIKIIEEESFLSSPNNLYEPIEYAMHQGGKRIRPLLALMAAELFSGDIEKAKPAAIAIEVLHNFTLLHDDIMDKSPLRRGMPTVYNKYDTNTAILSGDTMFAKAFTYLLKADKTQIHDLVEVFTNASIEVCEGQAMDMCFEERDDVKIEEYIEMIRLKTGVLLASALKLGAITAFADKKDMDYLYDFGLNIGIAFQLQDDILDCWSNLEDFGKVTGTDIADNKKTFLYLKSLELAEKDDKEILIKYFSSTNFDRKEKEEAIKSIYHKLNLKAIAQELMQEYNNKAMESLEKIGVDNQRKQNLINFANILMHRNK